MLYHLSQAQFNQLSQLHFMADFTDAEMLFAVFHTDPQIARAILPAPLKADQDGLAAAFVAWYPETNFGCVYHEGALFLNCTYRGERGFYCLSMPVDDDTAMIGGREIYGYPKKMADRITLDQSAGQVVGSVVRKGCEILRLECQLQGEADPDTLKYIGAPAQDWNEEPCYKVVSFLFKYFQNPGGGGFDYFPRLIREPVLFRAAGPIQQGEGKVTLSSTPVDPLGEVPVRNVAAMLYGRWHNTMLPGKVVSKVWNPLKFARYAFFKTDMALALLGSYDPEQAERNKAAMRFAKKL